jgi:hypothetical protein
MSETTVNSALKVNVELVPQPMIEEFQLFMDSSSLVEAIQRGEAPRVSVSMKTKTRVSLSIKGGGGSWSLNHSSDKFKTHEQKTYSYATYKEVTNYYFKLSKKQNYSALIEYIKECVIKSLGNVINEEITINLIDNRDLRYIKVKFA